MRFSEIHLIRYGHFDRCRLAFPKMASDMHIVYGPNEAGKSTTMSAVTDLLFSFRHTADFDFRFDKVLLRVGGVIEGDGVQMTCRRKRGNARTLLDADEQPVDEAVLTGLLANQSRDSFLRGFSLDHARLREGGRTILEAKDDVGQAIFAAGSGLVGVTRLAEALDQEAKAIWSDRASATRLYYVALRAYEDARIRLRDSRVRSAHWADLKKALEGHERELHQLRQQRDSLQTSLQVTERRRRILAPIARLAHLQDQLAKLGDPPNLPADAGAILEVSQRQITENKTKARLAAEQAEQARAQLVELTFNRALLGHRARVTYLRAQQGAVDKGTRDTPALRAKAALAADQLRRLLKEVGWPDASARDVQAQLPGRPQVGELRDLLEEHHGLETGREAAAVELCQQLGLEAELNAEHDALQPLAIGPGFTAVLQDIRSQGDLDAALRSAQARLERAQRTLSTGLGSLSPWQGTVDALASLPLIRDEEATVLGEALVAAEEALIAEETKLNGFEEERAHRLLRRQQLLRDEHAVSADMLQSAREARDATWSEVSSHLNCERLLDSAPAVQRRFSDELREADILADRRFDAAETSAALLSLDHDVGRLDLSIAQSQVRYEAVKRTVANARQEWSVATCAVGEVSPDGLKTWRAARDRVLELAQLARTELSEVEHLTGVLESSRRQLASVLPATAEALQDATLSALLLVAGDLEVQARNLSDRRTDLKARLKAAEQARRRAEAKQDEAIRRVSAWRERWVAAVRAAGLDPGVSLSLLRARLDLLDEIRDLSGKIVGFEQRVSDIANDVAAFSTEIEAVAAEFQLSQSDREPSAVLSAIEQQLDIIAACAERAEGLRAQVEDADARAARAEEKVALAQGELAPLFSAAAVNEPDELGEVIQRAEAAKSLLGQIDEITSSLLSLGDGLGLQELLMEAAGSSAAELVGQSEDLQDRLRTLTAEIELVAEAKSAANEQFRRLNDRPDAAIAAADMAQARAEMETQAEAYVRKRAEATLLRWTIERYRSEKQAPLLKLASLIFSELTLGRYKSLGVDVEDRCPKLSGILSDGATVVPVKDMSEGTIDQLFLALRLAAVEESVDAGIRLPFLADDLFINYDDERSVAGLRVLARLAERTQVLFFTHHKHLADLARETLGPKSVSVCRLGELKMDA